MALKGPCQRVCSASTLWYSSSFWYLYREVDRQKTRPGRNRERENNTKQRERERDGEMERARERER